LAMSSALKKLALDDVLNSSATAPSRSNTSSSKSSDNKSSDDISAFDSYVISSPPKAMEPDFSTKPRVRSTNLAASRRALHGGINGRPTNETPTKNAFGLNVRRQSPEPTKTTTGFTAVAPNVLFTNNLAQPAAPAVTEAVATGAPLSESPSPVTSNAKPVGWKVPATTSASTDVTPQPSLFSTHRPFRCPQPGCQKSYKQANGLKYHMLKGQCNFEVRDAMEWAGLTQEEAEERAKPYACAAGDGCLKRYRQANGLKVSLFHCHTPV
jgi:transcription factor SFP1